EAPGARTEAAASTVKRLTPAPRPSLRRRGASGARASTAPSAPTAGAGGGLGLGSEADLPPRASDDERTELRAELLRPLAEAGPRCLVGGASLLVSSSGASVDALDAALEVQDLRTRLASMERQYREVASQLEASRHNHYLALRGTAAHEEAAQMRPVREPAAPALVCQGARPVSQRAPQRGRAEKLDANGLPLSLDPTRVPFCLNYLKRQLVQCQRDLRQSQAEIREQRGELDACHAECREQRQELEASRQELAACQALLRDVSSRSHSVQDARQRDFDRALQEQRREVQQLRELQSQQLREHELELQELRQQLQQQCGRQLQPRPAPHPGERRGRPQEQHQVQPQQQASEEDRPPAAAPPPGGVGSDAPAPERPRPTAPSPRRSTSEPVLVDGAAPASSGSAPARPPLPGGPLQRDFAAPAAAAEPPAPPAHVAAAQPTEADVRGGRTREVCFVDALEEEEEADDDDEEEEEEEEEEEKEEEKSHEEDAGKSSQSLGKASPWSKVRGIAADAAHQKLQGRRSQAAKHASEAAIMERGLASLMARWQAAGQAHQEPASLTTQRFFEVVESCLRGMEFSQRVTELMDMQGPDESHAREEEEQDVSAVMLKQYDAAFQSAGGQEKAEPYFDRVNRLCRLLREARPIERGRQDCSYEILGMSALYSATATPQLKLMREVRRIALESGGAALCPDLKGRDRARAKALTKYGNDTACLTDLMRASIVYPDIDSLYEAFVDILDDDLHRYRTDWHLVEVTDRFQKVRDGYRDISMLFRADGMVGEVQLHVENIVNAKKGGGHAHYRKQRLVNELMFEACVLNFEVQVMKLASEFHSCAATVCDKNGRTAFHYSCQHGSNNAVRVLLVNKADPWKADSGGLLPFELAMVGGHFETMELVLNAMKEAQPCDPRQATRLVENGFLVWVDRRIHDDGQHAAPRPRASNPALALIAGVTKEPQQGSTRASWVRVGKLLMEVITEHKARKHLDTWFTKNAAAGNTLQVLATLEAGFDTWVKPGTPSAMDRAIEGGHVELVTKLGEWLEGNPGVRCLHVSSRESVHSHLKRAAQLADPAVATAALAARADPSHTKARAAGWRTPLMAFAAAGDLVMCKRLIEFRAQAAGYDGHGCSALDYARSLEQRHVEEYLKELDSFPEMPFRKASERGGREPLDLGMYVCGAVHDGCCGAISRVSTALAGAEEGSFKQSSISNECSTAASAPFRPRCCTSPCGQWARTARTPRRRSAPRCCWPAPTRPGTTAGGSRRCMRRRRWVTSACTSSFCRRCQRAARRSSRRRRARGRASPPGTCSTSAC
ncbi:unnamed protein product, partial [Prorocentrum cordatum]